MEKRRATEPRRVLLAALTIALIAGPMAALAQEEDALPPPLPPPATGPKVPDLPGRPEPAPAAASPAAPGSPEKGVIPKDVIKPEGVLLRLDAVDIALVIDLYSRITDRIVLPVPDLKGKITIINRKRLPVEQAARLIEGALDLQGWTIIPQGKVARLVKSKDAVKRFIPTIEGGTERSLSDVNRVQTHLIPIKYVKGDDVKNLISPLLSNDGTIQYNERTNLLVITEVSSNMSRLLELISQVDRPLSTREEIVENVALRYVAPKKMVDTIKEYFKATTLRFLPDERLQTLLLTGRAADVHQATTLIALLDRSVPREQTTNQIIRIQYAKADAIAALIQNLYKNRADPLPPTFSINADKDSNSVILTGPPELRDEIAGLISRVDIRYQQVQLKMLIGEVSIDPSTSLGFQWGHLVGSNSEFAQDFGGIGLSSARSAVRTSTAGIRYSLLQPQAYSLFINALSTLRTFNILASPHITVTNNHQATFKVGSQVPVQTSERISTGNDTVRSSDYKDVSLSVKAQPSITFDGEIAMDLELEFSELGATSPISQNPEIITRQTKTNVIIKDQHSLVISGLMRHDIKKSVNKVPFLGDAPVIGALFRTTSEEKPKQELLVLLTPTIMRTSDESDVVADAYERHSYADEKSRSFQKLYRDQLQYTHDIRGLPTFDEQVRHDNTPEPPHGPLWTKAEDPVVVVPLAPQPPKVEVEVTPGHVTVSGPATVIRKETRVYAPTPLLLPAPPVRVIAPAPCEATGATVPPRAATERRAAIDARVGALKKSLSNLHASAPRLTEPAMGAVVVTPVQKVDSVRAPELPAGPKWMSLFLKHNGASGSESTTEAPQQKPVRTPW